MGASSCLGHAGKAAISIGCRVNAGLKRGARESGDRGFAEFYLMGIHLP
jgi:hypothetical protein